MNEEELKGLIRRYAVMFFAETKYKLDNPNETKFTEPPSMVYEWSEDLFDKWLAEHEKV